MSVEGRWELRDPDGQIIDQTMEPTDRDSYHVHRILGQTVATTFVNAPMSFGLKFGNGSVLEIFDDSEQFESCQISPTGVII